MITPSLSLDLTALAALPGTIAFARASQTTRFNAAGVMETLANDAPGFDHYYDAVAKMWKPRGLQSFLATTNVILQSADLSSTAYSKNNLTPTYNVGPDPMGGMTADLLHNPGGGGVNHFAVHGGIGLTAGQPVLFSQYVQRGPSGGNICLRIQGAYPNMVNVCFDPVAEAFPYAAIYQGFTDFRYGIEKLPSGICRLWCSAIPNATYANGTFVFGPSTLAVFGWEGAAGGAASAYFWGRDAILGQRYPAPHIPTAAAPVTRQADSALITGANFTAIWQAAAMTLAAEYEPNGALPVAARTILEATAATAAERAALFLDTNGDGRATAVSASATVADIGNAVASAAIARIAARFKLDSFASSANGLAAATDNAGAMPLPDRLSLGQLNGWLRRVIAIKAGLTNDQLQGLSRRRPVTPAARRFTFTAARKSARRFTMNI